MQHELWDRDTFVMQLRNVGADHYHDKHQFHRRMNAGDLSRAEIRNWIVNRFYYQQSIPLKDAAILSNCNLRDVRRKWLHRIIDHDGAAGTEGGIEAWLRLAEACEIEREVMLTGRELRPGVQYAVDAYVNFARTRPWPIAVASSLTELFAPDLMAERLAAFERHYGWISTQGLEYFRQRVTQASSDSNEGLAITLQYCNTPLLQREAVLAIEFKCNVLWEMLDAISRETTAGDSWNRLTKSMATSGHDSHDGLVCRQTE
jgi:pyrroloquinoline-quinone synthase